MAVGQYILDDDGNPVPEPDLLKWAMWMEYSPERVLQQDKIGDAYISTIFLGLDHRGDLWETMIFGGEFDHYQNRYKTRTEALGGHAAAVQMVKSKWN